MSFTSKHKSSPHQAPLHHQLYGAESILRHVLRPGTTSSNKLVFNGEELLVSHLTSKLEDYPLLAVHDCLFIIFAATFHTWRMSPPSTAEICTMPW
jgi:hypothetical protein